MVQLCVRLIPSIMISLLTWMLLSFPRLRVIYHPYQSPKMSSSVLPLLSWLTQTSTILPLFRCSSELSTMPRSCSLPSPLFLVTLPSYHPSLVPLHWAYLPLHHHHVLHIIRSSSPNLKVTYPTSYVSFGKWRRYRLKYRWTLRMSNVSNTLLTHITVSLTECMWSDCHSEMKLHLT
uniref:Uncharacterized protein n=2 Tax=Cacopsylla melanoneura TaxID=428564 RepID=A0A8D9B693_9HEMI